MSKDIVKFIKSSVIVIIALIIVDIIVSICGDIAVRHMPDFGEQRNKGNYRLNRMTDDIVLIGPSTCSHTFVTEILSDSINRYLTSNYKAFNAGIDGRFSDCNAAAIESILDRYSPKYIIWENSDRQLIGGAAASHLQIEGIFYSSNKFIKDYIDRWNWKEKTKYKSALYRYNEQPIRLLNAYMSKRKPDLGYSPLFGTMKLIENEQIQHPLKEKIPDDWTVENMKRVFALCNNKNIPIIVVTTPQYGEVSNPYLDSICRQSNVPYIDDINKFNNRPDLFRDKGHLNDDGAKVYTKMFFEEIKQYLK